MLNATRLKWTTLFHVCCRSLLLQASWNFERLQNLGYLYLVLPGLRSIYGSPLPLEVLQRHAGYFNTHPYLTPLVAGANLRLEARLAAGEDIPVDITTFKNMVIAPFAAMGDALFWGGVRPLAAVISLFFATQGSLWAPVVFLVLFNLPHLIVRIAGMVLGYVQELRVVETVRLKEMTIVLLGVLSAFLAQRSCLHQDISPAWGFVLLPVIFLYAWLARKGLSSLVLVLITTLSLLGLAILF